MKRLPLAAVLALALASVSFAGVQDFGVFTVDVPSGWTAEQDGTTVGFVKNDNTASMSVTVDENDGSSIDDLVAMFVKELNGKNLTKDKEGNAVFDFTTANGVTSKAVLNCDAKHFALIVLTGVENAQSEMYSIIDTLNFKE